MRVIAVANQKGGVGKTTTAVSLACGLARAGKRVLLVDCDPQGNATTSLGADKREGTAELLDDPGRLSGCTQAVGDEGVDLVCGTFRLRDADGRLSRGEIDGANLEAALVGAAPRYDFAVLDCPPSLNHLTLAALSAASGVLIPLQAEFLSLEGLAQMREVLDRLRAARGKPELFGILVTQVPDASAAAEIRAEIDRHFPNALFQNMIGRDPLISECPSHGRSVFSHAPRSVGAYHYLRFVQEALRRSTILEPVQ